MDVGLLFRDVGFDVDVVALGLAVELAVFLVAEVVAEHFAHGGWNLSGGWADGDGAFEDVGCVLGYLVLPFGESKVFVEELVVKCFVEENLVPVCVGTAFDGVGEVEFFHGPLVCDQWGWPRR